METKTILASQSLPPFEEMYLALCDRDPEYEGVFFVGVKTTGIFCRPTCPARKPKRENIDFYPNASEALSAGFRPCKRCRPMEVAGTTPEWLRGLLAGIESAPGRRMTDDDVRARGIEPARVRRWFKQNHGMTFHAYQRARRLSKAMGQIHTGNEDATGAALANGYQSLSGFREAFKNWFGQPPARSKDSSRPLMMNRILTPLGPMIAVASESALCLLEFADRRMLETQLKRVQKIHRTVFAPGMNDLIAQTEQELNQYFDGDRTGFSVPLDSTGTPFQMEVWSELLKIPAGETRSYERLARNINRPGAQRAVGRANGDNRLAIIIPCHRVIRSDGSLSGYGGGIWRKRWLLEHERNGLF
ncbi:MAG: methylated-DNA--[protein]-cysteine S-methyltransferase [Planctomycetota bacterium]